RTNSCAGNRDKAPRRKRSQFLELIGSVAVPAPADYTRYIYEPTVYLCGKVGETVKYGWAGHPRRGTVGPTPRMQTQFCPFNMMLATERSYAASRSFAPFHPREARSRSE